MPPAGDALTPVIYTKALFDLEIEFAQTVAALSGLPLARTLLDYTNFYIRFGLGRDFDPTHPVWLEYLAGLREGADPREWTYDFYLRRPDAIAAPALVATVGCFSYGRLSSDRIRLHFHNAETDGRSPLAIEYRDRRLAELAELFAHVKRTASDAQRVVGASWLYNLEAYRRLFPASYVATARVVGDRFRHMPSWRQFVNRHGNIRESMARQFRERLGRQSSLDGLSQCFPFQVLAVESPVREFYEFLAV